MSRRITRRRFLAQTSALTAASLVPSLRGEDKKASPNERLNIAVIGVAAQGEYDLSNVTSENIVALCDVDVQRAEKARVQHPDAHFYTDYRKMLDQKDVDAVVVATPDHHHAFAAVPFMRLGKHVYCEKPLAHSVNEIRLMMQVAAENKVVTQMGTQIHASDNYRRVVELVQSGAIGAVGRVHVWCAKRPDPRKLNPQASIPPGLEYDLWVGPAPMRQYDPAFVPFHWRWWWDFGGGILADMACHYMDLPHWALGLRTPTTVEASGKKLSAGPHDVPDVLQADYQYAARGAQPAVHLTWYSGVAGPSLDGKVQYEGFGSGVLFEGTKGKLLADYGHWKLLPEDQFKDFAPPPPTIPKSIGHHKEWIEAIKHGKTTTCDFAYSGALAETVLLGNVAFRSGQKIEWDEKAGRVTNTPDVNRWLQREYREGWTL